MSSHTGGLKSRFDYCKLLSCLFGSSGNRKIVNGPFVPYIVCALNVACEAGLLRRRL